MTKYTDTDIYENPSLGQEAIEKLSQYSGTNSFLLDVKQKLATYGNISVAQKRAVLNVLEQAEAEPAEPAVRDGTYTLTFEDDSYTTIRLHTPDFGSFAGKQIASYLSGPDNTRNYTAFAFVNGKQIQVWRRMLEPQQYQKQKLGLFLLVNSDDPALFGLAYAERSGNCFVCGRKLTVPASLHRGMGPICAQGGRD